MTQQEVNQFKKAVIDLTQSKTHQQVISEIVREWQSNNGRMTNTETLIYKFERRSNEKEIFKV